jgi:molecular chaperone GrpE
MTQEEDNTRPIDEVEASPESRRRCILEKLEDLLNKALEEEDPPSGIEAEILSEIQGGSLETDRTDLFSLWSAMTTLTQEVKLQGRAFKQLEEAIKPWIASAETFHENHAEALSEARRFSELASTERHLRDDAILRAAEKRVRGDVIGVLVDLRDRLKRGAESAGAHIAEAERTLSSSWLDRFRGNARAARAGLDAVKAILEGYLLSLERIEQALAEMGLQEIDCEGARFDPHLMKAVDIEESTEEEVDGQVLKVYRSGFLWDKEIFRPAEVKVARANVSPIDEEEGR